MSGNDFSQIVSQIAQEDKRYKRGAYYFVREALDHTIRSKNPNLDPNQQIHISGQMFLEGIREYAKKQYGPMTMDLFKDWGINACKDFGEIVFNLVDYGVLGRTDQDRREDFAKGFDFEEEFVKPYLPKSKK